MRILRRTYKFLAHLEGFIVAGGILVISASVLVNVFCREAGIILIGAEEIAQFAMIWLTFFGTGLCARKGIHICMNALLDKIPEKQRKGVIVVICAITGVFSIILGYLGVLLTMAVFSRGQVSPALRIPVWYFYMCAPMGFFLTGLHYLLAFMRNLREKGLYLGVE
jgi:TRAP-type C4-dicarboxylate transport system permease small subunit